jgi:thiosulfate dehydrogenase [quinone] large subunit
MITPVTTKALAVARIATGFVFLWAFADKLLGLRYSTVGAKSWLQGGSPTKGFLGNVHVGPFQSVFRSMAGTWWADSLFMLGLLAVGAALVLGIGLRVAAASGSLMMAMMWAAEWPLAQHDSLGQSNGSSNPLVDYHVLYAIVLVVLACAYAGTTWGLGQWWAKQAIVQKNRWLL